MDFKQARQKKERGTSVRELAEQLQAQQNDYVDVIVLGVKEDGDFDIGFSTDHNAKAIGYLEMAKEEIIYDLMYEED